MNKTSLRKAILAMTDLPPATVEAVLAAQDQVVEEALVKGENVTVGALGILKPMDKPARKARNPNTGEEIIVPARREVKFQVSSNLKKNVAGAFSAC